jgi:hypothetical protein
MVMSIEEARAFGEMLAETVGDIVDRALDKRLTPLIERVERLEDKSLLYEGVWRDGEYARGATVVDHGGLWRCETKTTMRPGTGADWRLITKRGAFDRRERVT